MKKAVYGFTKKTDILTMKRINVVGTSGSGKSTFSRSLANSLKYPYIEMDALFWKPNWQESTDKEFFERLNQALDAEKWILDGNYNRSAPIKFSKADTIIWLDYSFGRTLYQAISRAFKRSITRKELWKDTGNYETFTKSFFSHDSVVLWTVKTYSNNKARYHKLFNDPQYADKHFVRITNPKMARSFIDQLSH